MSETATLPTNFKKNIDVFQQYSKAPHKLAISSQETIKPGHDTTITFPVKVQDLKTFQTRFNAKTGGDATHMVGFPQYMACLINKLVINLNGHSIVLPNYNIIYKTMKDYNISYEQAIKKIGTNPDPSCLMTRADDGTVAKYNRYTNTGDADVNSFDNEYVIDDWIGFLGSVEPSIMNGNLIGDFSVTITWEDPKVLWGDAGSTFDYEITNFMATIDVLDFKDKNYYDGIEKKMASTGYLEFPFKHYRLQTGRQTTNNKTTEIRFTESGQSLDKIMFSYLDINRNTNAPLMLGDTANIIPDAAGADVAGVNTYLNDNFRSDYKVAQQDFNYEYLKSKDDPHLLNTSRYFRRNGLGMKNSTLQFEINGGDVPSYPLTLLGQYQETLKTFELNENDLKEINPGIKDLVRYEKDYYLCALSLQHINDKRDITLISGRDTQATSIQLAVKVTQNSNEDPAQSALPFIITEKTSVLRIYPGRELDIVN